jgi:transcriptional regulator with XRE-family HTH domain
MALSVNIIAVDMTTKVRFRRELLGISQSKLARISGVSRFKIYTYELGGRSLSDGERGGIEAALHAEAARIRSVAGTNVDADKAGLMVGK